jgi:hypothetical protein
MHPRHICRYNKVDQKAISIKQHKKKPVIIITGFLILKLYLLLHDTLNCNCAAVNYANKVYTVIECCNVDLF